MRKFYDRNGVVCYAPDVANATFIFMYSPATAEANPSTTTLADVYQRWSRASVGPAAAGRVRRRSIFFGMQFWTPSLPQALDEFFLFHEEFPDAAWGRILYWLEPFRDQLPDDYFPHAEGRVTRVSCRKLELRLAKRFQSLDDFILTWDGVEDNLHLSLGAGNRPQLYYGGTQGVTATTTELQLPFRARDGFSAGALFCALPLSTADGLWHPVSAVGINLQAVPTPSRPPVALDIWFGSFCAKVEAGAGLVRLQLGLDPRDGLHGAWPSGFSMPPNSRVEFGGATIHTNFFDTVGRRIGVRPAENAAAGVARLKIVFDTMGPGGTATSSGDIVFAPDGDFMIELPTRQRGESLLQLVVGRSATEYVSVERSRPLSFAWNQPALFRHRGKGDILESLRGFITTAWLRLPAEASETKFYTESAEAALFRGNDTPDLHRANIPYGSTAPVEDGGQFVRRLLPVFPWAGLKPLPGAPARMVSDPETRLQNFEGSHLSEERRLQVHGEFTRFATGPDYAITPQGLLARIDPASGSDYARLYFGNPDLLNDGGAEFSLRLRVSSDPADRKAYDEIQRALRGAQLFVVVDRPTLAAQHVAQFSTRLKVREFIFELPFTTPPVRAEHGPIALLKYFRGRSLANLIDDPASWAARDCLAPEWDSGAAGRIKELVKESAEEKEDPASIANVWDDPNWMGVLLLDLEPAAMPELLESIRPGMKGGELRVHHLGLNFLPVKAGDLEAGDNLNRPVSAFGKVRYVPRGDALPANWPATNDREPGSSGTGNRQYRFIVTQLSVGFANSTVSSFQARLIVAFTHLFWDSLRTPAEIELLGAYESRPDSGNGQADVFSLRTEGDFPFQFRPESWIETINIRRAQLTVTRAERSGDKLKSLESSFAMDVDVTLSAQKAMPVALFRVKAIHCQGVALTFKYVPDSTFECGFDPGKLAADIEFGDLDGLSSILNGFPLRLKGMIAALGDLLSVEDLGFKLIPLNGISANFHFAFNLELDLGFLGSLAGDLKGLKVPMLLGWRGGSLPSVAFGIKFPTLGNLGTRIDIGIQQFIRLRAEQLLVRPCPDNSPKALVIALQRARLEFFGKEWPTGGDVSLMLFFPFASNRKVAWAFGYPASGSNTPGTALLQYLGAGHRITAATGATAREVVENYQEILDGDQAPCAVGNHLDVSEDGWVVVGKFQVAEVITLWLAVADRPGLWGIRLELPLLGSTLSVDVLYRRVNDSLGIFSAEIGLPTALRTIQMGVVSFRLPTFRIEIHTDGGFLVDLGYPWRNDFSRSAQAEVGIFLGSGGIYYGQTAAVASSLLQLEAPFRGFQPVAASNPRWDRFRAVRCGIALRVGIGRSITLGIMEAEASLTIFGGIEGAAAYLKSEAPNLSPRLYSFVGFVGIMAELRAQVNFAIIRASVYVQAYVMAGIQFRRLLAFKAGTYYALGMPVTLFAELGILIEVRVEIRIGCFSVTIRLRFSATWRIEEYIGDMDPQPLDGGFTPLALPVTDAFEWSENYRCFAAKRDLDFVVTVLPCLAAASDVGGSEPFRTGVIGQTLLSTESDRGGFLDYAKFLVGWVLFPEVINGIPDDAPVSADAVRARRQELRARADEIWESFPAILLQVSNAQFTPKLHNVDTASEQEAYATVPFWPGMSFGHVSGATVVPTTPVPVIHCGREQPSREAAFGDYARCLITTLLVDVEQIAVGRADGNIPWAELWENITAR